MESDLVKIIQNLLVKIQQLQSIMVDVATGRMGRIEVSEGEYAQLYSDVSVDIEKLQKAELSISNPNPFKSIWDWKDYWHSNLTTHESKRKYIHGLYVTITNSIEAALYKHRVEATTQIELFNDLKHHLCKNPLQQSSGFQITLESLHPMIVSRCRVSFETEQYDLAIFNAIKIVEAEIRRRISADADDVGVDLISKAMSPKSPKLVFSDVSAEKEAAHSLYRGAVGIFKNPLSHRFIDINDPVKTFEVLSFASHLMRMLDNAKG